MNILLTIRRAIDEAAKTSVCTNIMELPSPNQAVSEKGMYILRNTKAKSTENVTVPMS